MNDIITLPSDLQDYVDRKVLSGEFAEGIDVIAAALTAMMRRDMERRASRRDSENGIPIK